MNNYKYLRAWCRMMNSSKAYTESEILKARAELAPETAIYRGPHGVWRTFEEIKDENTKRKIAAMVEHMED